MRYYKGFLQFYFDKKSFTQLYFIFKSILLLYDSNVMMFFIILFGINELYKLWKKTFKTIHKLSCFVGHPVVRNKTYP